MEYGKKLRNCEVERKQYEAMTKVCQCDSREQAYGAKMIIINRWQGNNN